MNLFARRTLVACAFCLTTNASFAQTQASIDQSALVLKNLSGVADSIATLRDSFKPEDVKVLRDQLQKTLNAAKGLAAAGGALAAVSAVISIIDIIENKPTPTDLIRKDIAKLGHKVDNLQDYLGDISKRTLVYTSLQTNYQTLNQAEDNLHTAATLLSGMNAHDFVNQSMIGTKSFVNDAISLERLCNTDNDSVIPVGGPNDQSSIFKKIEDVYFADEVMLLNASYRLSSALVEGQAVYAKNYLRYVSDSNHFDSFSNGLEIIIDRNNPDIQSTRSTWLRMFRSTELTRLAKHVDANYTSMAGTGDTSQRSSARQKLVNDYLKSLKPESVQALQREFALVTAEAHFSDAARTCANSFAKIENIDRKSFESYFADFIDFLLNDSDKSYVNSVKLVEALEAKYPSKAWAAVVYNDIAGFDNHLINTYAGTKWITRFRNDRHDKNFIIGYEDESNLGIYHSSKLRLVGELSTQTDIYKVCEKPGVFDLFKKIDALSKTERTSAYADAPIMSYDNIFDQCYLGCTGRKTDYPGLKNNEGTVIIRSAASARNLLSTDSLKAPMFFGYCPKEFNDLRRRATIGRIFAGLDTGRKAPYYTVIMGRTDKTDEPDITVSGNWQTKYTKSGEYWTAAFSNEPN